MRTQKILNRFLKIVVDLHAEKFFLSVFYLAGCSNDVADINALHLSWRCPWRIKPERDCVCEHWCVLVHVRSEAWLLLSEQRGKKRRLSTFPGVACLSVRLADCVFVCLFLFSPTPPPWATVPSLSPPPPPPSPPEAIRTEKLKSAPFCATDSAEGEAAEAVDNRSLEEILGSIPPPPPPAMTNEPGAPRLMITHLVNRNFKSYAGEQILGPFHKVRPKLDSNLTWIYLTMYLDYI